MQRLLLIALLALAGAVLGWLFWMDGAPVPPPGPDVSPDRAPAPAEASFATGELADDNGDDGAPEPQVPGDGPLLRDELPSDPAAEVAEAPPITVRVVGPGKVPVPGAEVHWLDFAALPTGKWPAGVTDATIAERLGKHSAADQNGEIRLPSPRSHMRVSAAANGMFGLLNLNRRQSGTATIELRRDETLQIQVVEADQRPAAAVSIGIHNIAENERNQIYQGDTDARGMVVIPHFQTMRPKTPKGTWLAAVRVPLVQPLLQAFDAAEPPAEPIRFVLPPQAAVDLRVLAFDGEPLLMPATVGLRVLRTESEDPNDPSRLLGNYLDLRQDKPAGGLAVNFPRFGLGVDLEPWARIGRERVAGTPVRSDKTGGKPVAATVTLPVSYTLLEGRVLGPGGTPLADTAVTMVQIGDDGGQSHFQVHTVADGRFDHAMKPLGGPALVELHFVSGEVAYGVQVRLPVTPAGQRVQLGTLQLQPVPLLLAGVVVDDAGQPLAEAELQLQHRLTAGNRQRWAQRPPTATRSAADGTFRLHGFLPALTSQVRISARRCFPSFVPLPHAAEVRVVLTRHGSLSGQISMPEWLPQGSVTLELASAEQPRNQQQQQVDGARFRFGGLGAGMYSLTARLRNVPDAAVRLDGIFVGPGDQSDARLQPLDLRHVIQRYELRAVDQNGALLADHAGPILLRATGPDGNRQDRGFRWQKGVCEILTPATSIEVTAFGRGFAPTTQTLSPGQHLITLTALHPARLNLPGARNAAGPTRTVRVSMVFVGNTGLPDSLSGIDQRTGEEFQFPRWDLSRSNGAWLRESDVVEVPLSRNGKYEVVLRIYENETERGVQSSVPLGQVDVRLDGPGPETYTLAIDYQKVQEAIAQIVQQRAAADRNRTEQRNREAREALMRSRGQGR